MRYVYEFRATPRPRLTLAADSPRLPLTLAADDVLAVEFPNVVIEARLRVPGVGVLTHRVGSPLTYEVTVGAPTPTGQFVTALRACGAELVRVEAILRDVVAARLADGVDLTPPALRAEAAGLCPGRGDPASK